MDAGVPGGGIVEGRSGGLELAALVGGIEDGGAV